MIPEKTTETDKKPVTAAACDLPMRCDLPPDELKKPQPYKDIHKTRGGKATDFFIYGLLGFGANSAGSLAVTYYANPKPWAKNARESVTNGLNKLVEGMVSKRDVNRVTEIAFMLISGTVITAVMAPLVGRRDRIAHWVNKKIKKDVDVLPEHLRPVPEAKTVEDKIEQEIHKRVNYKQSSGDLWKSRWTTIFIPLIGDGLLSKANTKLEKAGKWSVDSASWRVGQKLYDDVLPEKSVKKLSAFFKKHGASIEDMKVNSSENYDLLSAIEKKTNNSVLNEERMMIADQTRLLGKELGWTLILAGFVEKFTRMYQTHRIHRQEKKAIEEITRQGLIPEGYKVVLQEGVKLQPVAANAKASWVEKSGAALKPRLGKTADHVAGIEASRGGDTVSPAL